MSLYRTWRPKTFRDLVGQDAVVRTLSSALESGKLAHAYLFSGPRGSGKTSAAKILARCINCVNGPTAAPDNSCPNCLAMLEGTALDVLEIDAASNRGIDEIRALRESVKFSPSTMRMKVYVIDEAHMLTKEGANAFLKTLEEPPEHAVFILATTEPERLPVTILSRCQRYAFRRIAIPVMIERMREIARAEGIGIDDEALSAIAYRADGGLRDALTMLEQAAAFAAPEGGGAANITLATLDLAFGTTGREYASRLLDAALAGEAAGALAIVGEASDAGNDMQVLMRALTAEFRNLLVGRVDETLLARDLAPEDAARVAARARDVAQPAIVRALRLLSDALATARLSGNARLELETALLRYVLVREDPSLDALATRVAALESGAPAPAPAPVAPPEPPRPVAAAPPAPPVPAAPPVAREPATSGPVTVQKVRAAWAHVRSRVEGERASLRGPLSRAVVHGLEGNAIHLRVPDQPNAEVLRPHLAVLERAVGDVLEHPFKVVLEVDTSGARPRSATAPVAANEAEDPDLLFKYAEERIRES